MTKTEKIINAMMNVLFTMFLTLIYGGLVFGLFWFVGVCLANINIHPIIASVAAIEVSTIAIGVSVAVIKFIVKGWKLLLKEIES